MKTKWMGAILALLLVALISTAGVSAAGEYGYDVNGKPLKYPVRLAPTKTEPCIVKINTYDDGTPFKVIYGIEGRRSNGSAVCYVPRQPYNVCKDPKASLAVKIKAKC